VPVPGNAPFNFNFDFDGVGEGNKPFFTTPIAAPESKSAVIGCPSATQGNSRNSVGMAIVSTGSWRSGRCKLICAVSGTFSETATLSFPDPWLIG